MRLDRDRPYNDLPPLPPKVELETREVFKKVVAASRALAELKGSGGVIPDQKILVSSIVLQEAKLSSEIENIFTTNDKLYQAVDAESATDPQTKEVLRYREALWSGYERLRERPLSTNLFVDLVQSIKQTGDGIRRVPGTRIANNRGEVIYAPPEGEPLIRDLLGNLERFLHDENGPDPLVRLAVAHYQFEAIHPFTDGNGRTGRIVNILYLVEQGLLDLPVLYLSHYIIHNRADYYTGLRRVTEEGAWESWVLYMLDAVEVTARQTRERIVRIRETLDASVETARERAPKIYSKELVELLFERPYCRIAFLEERGIAKRQAAAKYLYALEEIGLLMSVKAGREVYFVNDRLLALLKE
jgi:Fic family protein